MKLASVAISAVALFSPLVSAWDVDPRCPPPPPERRLEPDKFLEEDGLVYEELSPPEQVVHSSEMVESERNLRGSEVDVHRELADVEYFQLRMYWEEGYCWQEEWKERKWCWECEGGSCGTNDYIWIEECSSSSLQRFVYDNGRIKPYTNQGLCLERTGDREHRLKSCSGSDKQKFDGFQSSGSFELHPKGQGDRCLSQHHHPKSYEVIRGELCKEARNDKTSKWFLYNKKTGSSSGSGGSSSGGSSSSSGGSSNYNDKGSDYCQPNRKCGMCEGDCDSDDDCEGNLVCKQRGPGDPVPGCNGTPSSGE